MLKNDNFITRPLFKRRRICANLAQDSFLLDHMPPIGCPAAKSNLCPSSFNTRVESQTYILHLKMLENDNLSSRLIFERRTKIAQLILLKKYYIIYIEKEKQMFIENPEEGSQDRARGGGDQHRRQGSVTLS